MPLQVRAFPKYLPQILSSYVGRLGERVLTNDRRIVPLRANLEYFDALPIQAVANIEFWTYVRRRSALGQESRHGIFDALNRLLKNYFPIQKTIIEAPLFPKTGRNHVLFSIFDLKQGFWCMFPEG